MSYQTVDSVEEVDSGKVVTLDMSGTLIENYYTDATHKEYNLELGIPHDKENGLFLSERDDETGDLEDHISHSAGQTSLLIRHGDPSYENYMETTFDLIQDKKILHGAKEFIKDLEQMGYDVMILSSSPEPLVEYFAEQLEPDYVFRWKDFLSDDSGEFQGTYVNPEGRRGKSQIIERLQESGADVIHFGNVANDVNAVETADAGLKQYWTEEPIEAYEWARKIVQKFEYGEYDESTFGLTNGGKV